VFKTRGLDQWRMRLALTLTALLLTGGAPATPAEDAASPTGLISAKPTFWHVTQTGFGSEIPDFKLCTVEGMLGDLGSLKKFASPVSACTTVRSRNGDGSMSVFATCGNANMRSTSSASGDDLRVHLGIPQSGPPGGTSKRSVIDIHYVRLGDCPATMKPGQSLMPNGQIIDPAAMLTAILDPAKALAAAKADPANTPPPVTPILLSAKVVQRSFELEKYDPALCGHLKSSKPTYPFGSRAKRWDVQLMIGVRFSGEADVEPTVLADSGDPEDLAAEPNYTLRLGSAYAFTPPIAQQDSVRSAGPFSGKTMVRNDSRKAAEARGDTYCSVFRCKLSELDRDAFLRAFEATATRGGTLTISATGPDGPVTEEFSLQGLAGFIERTQACIKSMR